MRQRGARVFLVVVLSIASGAWADVEMLVPAPPKPPDFDDSALGLLDKDIKMDRDGWFSLLKEVRGAEIRTLKQSQQVSCAEDIERKLKIEGYALLKGSDLNIIYKESTSRDMMVAQTVDALQGYIDQKFAVRLLPALYITVAPKPGLKKEELKRSFTELLSGIETEELGSVKAYMMREFDPPVGFVCVEIELNKKANFDSIIRLLELSLGAVLNNQVKAQEQEFEKYFGAAARRLQQTVPPEPKYQWGR